MPVLFLSVVSKRMFFPFLTLDPISSSTILNIFSSFSNFACSFLSVVPPDPSPCSSPLPLPAPYSHHGSSLAGQAMGQRSEQAIFHMPEKKVKNFLAISGLRCYLEYIDPVAPIDVYTDKY